MAEGRATKRSKEDVERERLCARARFVYVRAYPLTQPSVHEGDGRARSCARERRRWRERGKSSAGLDSHAGVSWLVDRGECESGAYYLVAGATGWISPHTHTHTVSLIFPLSPKNIPSANLCYISQIIRYSILYLHILSSLDVT